MSELAKEKKLATQMGTQIHAMDNYRRVVELVQCGAIGAIREVHVWAGAKYHGGEPRPKHSRRRPKDSTGDRWLGPRAVSSVP